MKPRVVLDTNVVVSALRSRNGASHKLLQLVGTRKFDIILAVPLVLEYEDACSRKCVGETLGQEDIDTFLDYLCLVGEHREVFFLWRPVLSDPGDDMVLEAAVEGKGAAIITHNLRDFAQAKKFGIRVLAPRDFLQELEVGK